ncbi:MULTISPECIES: SGNH/GDSL hydrolase family protein [unclassified Streptomyces]|uniref:SGNH/GDSL hydrolase family protein n=1 Tax=unclassified Streptomyces TaxID=2593676 RepID=UPI0038076FD0
MRESLRRGVRGATAALTGLLTTALVTACSVGGTGATAAAESAAASPRPSASAALDWNTRPASLAALGDSITRGFDACGVLTDCPELSWATGSGASVTSVAGRLLTRPAARSWNLAASGARMADLPAQAERAVALRPQQVMILMGANDACAPSTARMTPVDAYRRDFAAALRTLHRGLPEAQVFVASVPDLLRLWDVGRRNALGRQIWKLGLCPSMLADPEATNAAANARRQAVRERVIAYNGVLAQECARWEHCRSDGGAVFDYRFTEAELSPWDWFHPSARGQSRLAGIVYGAAFGSGAVAR